LLLHAELAQYSATPRVGARVRHNKKLCFFEFDRALDVMAVIDTAFGNDPYEKEERGGTADVR